MRWKHPPDCHSAQCTDGKRSRNPTGSAPEYARLRDGLKAQRNFGSSVAIRRRFAEHDTHQAVELPGNSLALGRQRRGVESLDQPYGGTSRIATERIRSRCQLVQDYAQGEDIARGRYGTLQNLF